MLTENLTAINLIIFPDWLKLDYLSPEIEKLFKIILSHPYQHEIALIVDDNTDDYNLELDLEFYLSSLLLKISVETDINIPESLNLTIINTPEDRDFLRHHTNLFCKIQLSYEDTELLQRININNINAWDLDCNIEIYLRLSQYYLQSKQQEKSILVLQKAIQLYPQIGIIHFELIQLLQSTGKVEEAIKTAEYAAECLPDEYIFKIFKNLLLPTTYNSLEEIIIHRQRFTTGLQELINTTSLETEQQKKECLSGIACITNFFLAYQGYNDRNLQSQYGDLVHQIMAANYPQWVQPLEMHPIAETEKIRIGYLSYFLHSWSGTFLFLGWLKHSNKDKFEIYSYYTGDQPDEITAEFRNNSDFFYHIPHNLEALCQQVLADRLHILVFPELGMDGSTLRIAALRLAPVQCMAWGHPVTSGLPTIDYFLSSELMEPQNGQEHYRETLVNLPGISVSYPHIDLPTLTKSRSDYGLKDDAIVYISSQAPYKYLPQYDYIFAEIAAQVPNAQFMFLRTGIPIERLQRSFARLNLNYQDYCLFSPVLPRPDYLMLLMLCDVYLDTFSWSGGNTSLDAIACNLPIVTCPGEFMRGRHTYSFLKMMGVNETIANTETEYIEIAVKLGLDSRWNQEIKEKIKDNHRVLYDDRTCVKALETFYQTI